MQRRYELLDLLIAFRTDIDPGPRPGGNRIDADAALDDADVDRDLRRGSRLDRILIDEERYRTAQGMHRVADSEIAPAMAALTRESYLVTATAERLRGDVVGRGTIENEERANPVDQFRLPADVADSAQISLSFLADIGDQQQTVPDLRRISSRLQRLRYGQQRRQTRAVVGHARPAEVAVAVYRDVFFSPRRKNGIQMRRERDERALRVGMQGSENVSCTIDGYVPAERAELTCQPFGALLLEESRGRDAAKLQVNLIDPLLFPGKPLKGLADAWAVG